MKKCESCGYENKDNNNFCVKCGDNLAVAKKTLLPTYHQKPLKKPIIQYDMPLIMANIDSLSPLKTKSLSQTVAATKPFTQNNLHIQPLKLKKRGLLNSLVLFFSNLLWFVFCGFAMSIYYFIKGVALFITIIGIPFATQCFKFPNLLMAPFGKKVVSHFGKHAVFNVLWMICGGLLEYIAFILIGLLLCVTIVGIPAGLQAFKMARLFLFPFGAEIVKSEDFANRGRIAQYTKNLEKTIKTYNSNKQQEVNATCENQIEEGNIIETIEPLQEFSVKELAEKEAMANKCLFDLLKKVKNLKRSNKLLFFLFFLVLVVAVGYLFLGTTAVASSL